MEWFYSPGGKRLLAVLAGTGAGLVAWWKGFLKKYLPGPKRVVLSLFGDGPTHELLVPTRPRVAMNIGAALTAARNTQGKSLREIANTTNIAPRILEALDRDDVSLLPGGIFGRGFVRAYAREVGIDPEPLVAELVARAHDAAPRSEPQGRSRARVEGE